MRRVIASAFACLAWTAFAAAPDLDRVQREWVRRFNADDEETVTNAVPNSDAEEFLAANAPRFACPDVEIERAYHFRWWTFRKHLRRAPAGEWVVTEFLPDVPWAGYGNMISCPFVHHLREGRWLRDPKFLDGYVEAMVKKGNVNGPRAYASCPAWSALDRAQVTGDSAFAVRLLGEFVRNYGIWEKGWESGSARFVATTNGVAPKYGKMFFGFRADRGLFDFAGNHEGTEFALSADGARPMVNSMMWAEADAISKLARMKGDAELAARFGAKADALAERIRARLWNPSRRFFTSLSADGKLDDVCELHGFAPFYFGLPLDSSYDVAFCGLESQRGFAAPIGLTFPRRDTPGFEVAADPTKHECLWNGPSWPYATSIALTALANRVRRSPGPNGARTFARLLRQYAEQHRLVRPDGKTVSWIDENLDPFTGEWLARKVMAEWRKAGKRNVIHERGKDYNHSTFCDLVIGGLVGIVPTADGFAVDPLAPRDWDFFALDRVRFRGREVAVRWRHGDGLVVEVDGREAARRQDIGRLEVRLAD